MQHQSPRANPNTSHVIMQLDLFKTKLQAFSASINGRYRANITSAIDTPLANSNTTVKLFHNVLNWYLIAIKSTQQPELRQFALEVLPILLHGCSFTAARESFAQAYIAFENAQAQHTRFMDIKANARVSQINKALMILTDLSPYFLDDSAATNPQTPSHVRKAKNIDDHEQKLVDIVRDIVDKISNASNPPHDQDQFINRYRQFGFYRFEEKYLTDNQANIVTAFWRLLCANTYFTDPSITQLPASYSAIPARDEKIAKQLRAIMTIYLELMQAENFSEGSPKYPFDMAIKINRLLTYTLKCMPVLYQFQQNRFALGLHQCMISLMTPLHQLMFSTYYQYCRIYESLHEKWHEKWQNVLCKSLYLINAEDELIIFLRTERYSTIDAIIDKLKSHYPTDANAFNDIDCDAMLHTLGEQYHQLIGVEYGYITLIDNILWQQYQYTQDNTFGLENSMSLHERTMTEHVRGTRNPIKPSNHIEQTNWLAREYAHVCDAYAKAHVYLTHCQALIDTHFPNRFYYYGGTPNVLKRLKDGFARDRNFRLDLSKVVYDSTQIIYSSRARPNIGYNILGGLEFIQQIYEYLRLCHQQLATRAYAQSHDYSQQQKAVHYNYKATLYGYFSQYYGYYIQERKAPAQAQTQTQAAPAVSMNTASTIDLGTLDSAEMNNSSSAYAKISQLIADPNYDSVPGEAISPDEENIYDVVPPVKPARQPKRDNTDARRSSIATPSVRKSLHLSLVAPPQQPPDEQNVASSHASSGQNPADPAQGPRIIYSALPNPK